MLLSTLAGCGNGHWGWSSRKSIVERLDNPARVTGWDAAGLELEGDRRIELSGLTHPRVGPLLTAATARGVEIDGAGGAIGLIDVHHWCGNDEIGRHVARVDLARLVEFVSMREGDEDDSSFRSDVCTQVGPFGWNVTCYHMFQSWSAAQDATRR